jgi:ABC-type polysaccharide/polyol phosphate transport system ATPase subunit
MTPIIEARDVTMHIPVYGMHSRSFRQVLFRRHTGGPIADDGIMVVKALQNLSFSASKGDRIGLIGHNGAGKTTLLRLLAKVYEPTAGRVSVTGRISALLSTNLGMDMEGNAYENIVNVGLLLGMSYNEIKAKTEEIAEFTELGDYLNLPVRTYSSGMQLRLTFAIVTAIEPDVLLLDEGFGAGDARFAARAQNRVNSLIEKTNVMVLATHSMEMVRSFCNKVVLLEQGRPLFFGDANTGIDMYQRLNEESLESS